MREGFDRYSWLYGMVVDGCCYALPDNFDSVVKCVFVFFFPGRGPEGILRKQNFVVDFVLLGSCGDYVIMKSRYLVSNHRLIHQFDNQPSGETHTGVYLSCCVLCFLEN